MLLKYIVFFIFCFNISALQAAEIIYNFDENERPNESLIYPSRNDLPHAARLRELLKNENNSPIGRMIIIGKYFDEKYPGNSINANFSTDIAQLFPELTQQEVYNRTNLIRQAVRIYRAGMQKYTEIKEQLLAPKEPPLIVDENDYALPGQHEYVDVPDGQVAVIYDFKKVLGYGNNPRDIKAMEAYRQKQLDDKKNKTAFEQFKSMVSKLEFSKIPFYGISLPNPFVGNAGIGEWQEQNGFKVRLLSNVARIAEQKEFLAAVHVNIPNHRFILSSSLSDELSKPEIELIEAENVQSYHVYYPLPVKVLNTDMIGAYAGDLAFPISLTTIDPHQGIKLKAKVIFQSCDYNLNCEKIEFFPELVIEQGIENAASSIMNFVKQSYYNLPPNQNKNLKLQQINVQTSPDGKKLEKLLFTFKFSGSINNFSLFLDDEFNSHFQAPKIAVRDSEIYVTVIPENNRELLLNQKAVMTVRLNSHTSLRQEITFADFSAVTSLSAPSAFHFVLFGLIIGFLFNFMPISMPLWLLFRIKMPKRKIPLSHFLALTVGVFTGGNLYAALLCFLQKQNLPFILGLLYQKFSLLTALILFLITVFLSAKYNLPLLKNTPRFKGWLGGVLLVSLLPFSSTPWLAENVFNLFYTETGSIFLFCNMLAAGISCFYVIIYRLPKIKFTQKVSVNLQNFLLLFSYVMLIGIIIWLLLIFFLQVSIGAFLKMLALILVFGIICSYVLLFLQALYQTTLPPNQKIITERIVITAFTILYALFAWFSADKQNLSPSGSTILQFEQNLNEKLLKGKIIIVGMVADWCPLCHINEITTLNRHNLERWNKLYGFEYVPFNIYDDVRKNTEFLKRHNSFQPPLYVLYSYHFENGLIVSPFLVDTQLEQIFEDAVI